MSKLIVVNTTFGYHCHLNRVTKINIRFLFHCSELMLKQSAKLLQITWNLKTWNLAVELHDAQFFLAPILTFKDAYFITLVVSFTSFDFCFKYFHYLTALQKILNDTFLFFFLFNISFWPMKKHWSLDYGNNVTNRYHHFIQGNFGYKLQVSIWILRFTEEGYNAPFLPSHHTPTQALT